MMEIFAVVVITVLSLLFAFGFVSKKQRAIQEKTLPPPLPDLPTRFN